MAKPKIKWDWGYGVGEGFEQLRRDSRTLAMLESHAEALADQLGDGFMHSSGQGVARPKKGPPTGRARASVYTATYKAMRRAANGEMIRALGSRMGGM